MIIPATNITRQKKVLVIQFVTWIVFVFPLLLLISHGSELIDARIKSSGATKVKTVTCVSWTSVFSSKNCQKLLYFVYLFNVH